MYILILIIIIIITTSLLKPSTFKMPFQTFNTKQAQVKQSRIPVRIVVLSGDKPAKVYRSRPVAAATTATTTIKGSRIPKAIKGSCIPQAIKGSRIPQAIKGSRIPQAIKAKKLVQQASKAVKKSVPGYLKATEVSYCTTRSFHLQILTLLQSSKARSAKRVLKVELQKFKIPVLNATSLEFLERMNSLTLDEMEPEKVPIVKKVRMLADKVQTQARLVINCADTASGPKTLDPVAAALRDESVAAWRSEVEAAPLAAIVEETSAEVLRFKLDLPPYVSSPHLLTQASINALQKGSLEEARGRGQVHCAIMYLDAEKRRIRYDRPHPDDHRLGHGRGGAQHRT